MGGIRAHVHLIDSDSGLVDQILPIARILRIRQSCWWPEQAIESIAWLNHAVDSPQIKK